jgi:hypothetical protein
LLSGVIRSRGTSQVKAIISATMSNVGRIQAFRGVPVGRPINAIDACGRDLFRR